MPGQSPLLEQASDAPTRIARVAVDVSLAHLDRLFDYEIPPTLADAVVPGCRVKVRFAGVLRDGYVIEIADTTEVRGSWPAWPRWSRRSPWSPRAPTS